MCLSVGEQKNFPKQKDTSVISVERLPNSEKARDCFMKFINQTLLLFVRVRNELKSTNDKNTFYLKFIKSQKQHFSTN